MNDWSDLTTDWQQLSPDLSAMARRVIWRGRLLRGYMWFQAIGTVCVLPVVFVWAYRTVPTTDTVVVLCVAAACIAGWWAVALPVWRDNRASRPPASAEQVRSAALRQVLRLRPLVAMECLIGLALLAYVGALWFHHGGKGPWPLYAGGGGFALLWGLGNLRYWLRLGREAAALNTQQRGT